MGRINTFDVAGAVGFVDGVDVTDSVTLGIAKMESFFLPANTLKANDVINIQGLVQRSSTSDSQFSTYIYWNQTDDLNTPILIGRSLTLSIQDDWCPIYRTIAIVDSTTTLVWNTSQTTATDLGDTGGEETDLAITTISTIDWNSDGYLILATDVVDTMTKRYFAIIK